LHDEDLNNPTSILDGVDAARYIRDLAAACRNPYTDGFTQCHCKHQLYVLKCFIEDVYKDLPEFPTQEKEWEQQRIMELLKK
jgi:hypothetical protein